ncbi:MAG: CoA pyrophosphatase [Leptospirales bacterium]|nr:CoA pyrophosphatase [Leptospirales bacterium]
MNSLTAETFLSRIVTADTKHRDPPTDYKRAAVAMILAETAAGGDLGSLSALFIKRSAYEKDPWSGHMAFPGGGVDPTDATPLAAAIREAEEEVGLALSSGDLVGAVPEIRASARGQMMNLQVYPFVFLKAGEVTLKPNEEVASTVWVPMDLILDESRHGRFVNHYTDKSVEMSCIEYQGYRIWGMTYRMIQNLIHLVAG